MPRTKSATLEIEFAELSDTGPTRTGNEDFVGHCAPATPEEARARGWLFVLADGVGGEAYGEVASRTAVESALAGFRAASAGAPLLTLLPQLAQQANADVHDAGLARQPAGGRAMATTLVLCGLRYDRMVVAHVGDSRCYAIRAGRIRQLTSDHTVANEQGRMGLLAGNAETSTRHILSRSLGAELFVSPDVSEHSTLPGDTFLLCSDGLHGAMPDSEMASVVTHAASLEAAAHELIAIANERDGGDNVSVQLVRVRGVERVGMYRGRPYLLR
jgi:protein phosphatase